MEPTSRPGRGYRGGKAGAGVYQKLINQMPPHTVYIEAFLGHGALLLHKRPAQLSIGLDLDPRAVHEVRTRLQHRQSGEACRSSEHDDNAAATLRTHRQSEYICSVSSSDDDAAGDIEVGPARYRLLVGDALAFLRAYPFTGSELVYCDPPYVRSTRRTRARAYRYEMDDAQHAALLAILSSLRCAVMVSGYRSPLYDELLYDWRTTEFQAMTRRGPATEVVWMNYEETPARHQYTYLGDNFHKREQITRVQGRWVQKLLPKPETEQTALLLAQLTRVGPTVRDAVLGSVLTQYGDEALIASNGTSISTILPSGYPADGSVPERPRASRCTICRHPARQHIDQALAAGDSLREIAQREGLSKSVLGRHLAHGVGREVSHLQTAISGTAEAGHQQGQTPRSEQLDLLALDTLG